MSGEHTGGELALEILALTQRALASLGVRESARIEGDALVLRRGSAETRAEIGGTLAQWESLPDDLRERRVQQIAELLAAKPVRDEALRLKPVPAAETARRSLGLRWYSALAPLSIVALTLGAIALLFHYLAPSGGLWGAGAAVSASNGSALNSADPDRERFLLASSACAHSRTRVGQGANLGPTDGEGWVVELALLRRGATVDLSRAPELGRFIARSPGAASGTVIWAGAPHLTAAQRFDAQVAISAAAPLGQAQASGLELVFSGPYVVPYFTEQARSDYFGLADALAEALGASEGALFARCASADSHQIGSWFLGTSPGDAVSSLVYFMASYTELPVLKPSVLGSPPLQRGHAFDLISEATAKMDRSTAATLIGRELGMVSGRPGHGTRLTFPFRDANRATRASVIAARALDLANSG